MTSHVVSAAHGALGGPQIGARGDDSRGMDATPDPHARRRRRATEVATLLCRIGGLLGSSLSLAGLGPSGAHRPLGLIVINVVSLVLVLGACYFTFVNLARPYGPQY